MLTLYRHVTDKLPTSYRHITNCRPTVGRLSADCRPTGSLCLGENLSADCHPSVGRQSTDRRPTVGRLLADSRPTVGRQLADKFFGELFFTITIMSYILFPRIINAMFGFSRVFQVLATCKKVRTCMWSAFSERHYFTIDEVRWKKKSSW